MRRMNSSVDPRVEAIRRLIDESTIPEEMASCMVMATAMDVVMNDVMERIRGRYKAAGLDVRSNDVLRGLKSYCQAVKTAGYWFDREVEPRNVECTIGAYGTTTSYDGFRARCGEVAEIVSMVVQASKDPSAMEKIRDAAREAARDRGVTLEDWTRLHLRTD